jgi:antitoxin component of MazEF toxin-antitoxin module
MKQIKKTIKFCNSIGIILPKIFADEMNIKQKDKVSIEYDEANQLIIIEKVVSNGKSH